MKARIIEREIFPEMEIVGKIIFGGKVLNVYDDLDNPWFLAVDVAKMIDYSVGNTEQLLRILEEDEKRMHLVSNRNVIEPYNVRNGRSNSTSAENLNKPYNVRNARGNAIGKWFVSELGLYNVLAQSRKSIAREWRRIVHTELIELRKNKGMNVVEQFKEWDERFDDLFYDDETMTWMQTITGAGGDPYIIPFDIDSDRNAPYKEHYKRMYGF